MSTLRNKTLFITGASRGIGKAIALRAARDGANIVIVAKTAEPHPLLPGTIYDAAREIEAAGGHALPLSADVRFEDQIQECVAKAVAAYGGIDILVNNASAISLTGTLETSMKRFDLMMDVNIRGTFACSQACLPSLKASENPHILVLAPPPDLAPKWFAAHAAYTLSKYGMSLLALGMAEEFRAAGVAVNALWPRTIIATAALKAIHLSTAGARKPEIVADAAYRLLCSPSRTTTGNFFIDEDVLRSAGVTNFDAYAVSAGVAPQIDLFVEEGTRRGTGNV
jgi:citronellol/citronellal dehydrogenase